MNFRLPDFDAMYRDMATSSAQLTRGQVWCHRCGATRKVESAQCLRTGWPTCCGKTMAIDSPEERDANRAR